jgi:hypothetical protein
MPRKHIPSEPPEPIAPENDTLIMSVELKSGRFSSSIEIPLFATDDAKKTFIDSWLNLMEAGLQVGRSHRDNTPKDETK